jgi:hypothetical protein
MIVQEIDPKTTKIKTFRVASNFTMVEIDAAYNRILFLKENQTSEIIQMKKENRYIISDD